MHLKTFRELLFKIALDMGCSAAQTRFDGSETFDVTVLDGEIDRYVFSLERTLTLRVKYNGKDGYASTQTFSDEEQLVRRAIDNARTIEVKDEVPMQGASEYDKLEPDRNCFRLMSPAQKIGLSYDLELLVKTLDREVVRVAQCGIITQRSYIELHNTLGLEAVSHSDMGLMHVVPVIESGGETKNAFAWRSSNNSLDIITLAKKAIKETRRQFNASPVTPGEYRVLLRNDALASLLGAFSDVFSASAAQKGLSLLAGREGEKIAVDNLTIMDDPFYSGHKRAFDNEGVPTYKKAVIQNGVLNTLLHSLKTALKAGTKSTGNGTTDSNVSPTNLYIAPNDTDYDTLIEHLGDGLIIADLSGLHSGVNDVSGDFSLLAAGYLVKNGKIERSVDQITVAGSFFDLLKSIEEIGSDLEFGIPSGMARIGAPSVIVSKLTVAG